MWEMSGDGDVARLRAQPIANPLRRIVRLQILAHREFRKGIAGGPEFLSRLLRAQLAAVPDDVGPGAEGGGFGRHARGVGETDGGQRAPGLLLRADGDAVMYQVDTHPS